VELKHYFSNAQGTGVLATSDKYGNVDAAIYSKPYVIDDSNVVFIMADRLTLKNLRSNPRGAFLFLEDGGGFVGKRLFMTKFKEGIGEDEPEADLRDLYEKAKRDYPGETLYMGYFRVDKVLALVSEH
jgi:hypothetical protein